MPRTSPVIRPVSAISSASRVGLHVGTGEHAGHRVREIGPAQLRGRDVDVELELDLARRSRCSQPASVADRGPSTQLAEFADRPALVGHRRRRGRAASGRGRGGSSASAPRRRRAAGRRSSRSAGSAASAGPPRSQRRARTGSAAGPATPGASTARRSARCSCPAPSPGTWRCRRRGADRSADCAAHAEPQPDTGPDQSSRPSTDTGSAAPRTPVARPGGRASSAAPGITMANSSPPSRATVSVSRTSARSRVATICSSWSPTP